MPAGNTNIMKKFINAFPELSEKYIKTYPNKNQIDEFVNNCDGEYSLKEKIEELEKSINECEDFNHNLKLTLVANQLKDQSNYDSMIERVNSYIDSYKIIRSELIVMLKRCH